MKYAPHSVAPGDPNENGPPLQKTGGQRRLRRFGCQEKAARAHPPGQALEGVVPHGGRHYDQIQLLVHAVRPGDARARVHRQRPGVSRLAGAPLHALRDDVHAPGMVLQQLLGQPVGGAPDLQYGQIAGELVAEHAVPLFENHRKHRFEVPEDQDLFEPADALVEGHLGGPGDLVRHQPAQPEGVRDLGVLGAAHALAARGEVQEVRRRVPHPQGGVELDELIQCGPCEQPLVEVVVDPALVGEGLRAVPKAGYHELLEGPDVLQHGPVHFEHQDPGVEGLDLVLAHPLPLLVRVAGNAEAALEVLVAVQLALLDRVERPVAFEIRRRKHLRQVLADENVRIHVHHLGIPLDVWPVCEGILGQHDGIHRLRAGDHPDRSAQKLQLPEQGVAS
mmetsp:Transcript_102087/g.173152  ORF Transcript_102087/g.173152 Transcript_102087/m.173152 type:complete len:392 (-) Transcript_102087:347-1522(-)